MSAVEIDVRVRRYRACGIHPNVARAMVAMDIARGKKVAAKLTKLQQMYRAEVVVADMQDRAERMGRKRGEA